MGARKFCGPNERNFGAVFFGDIRNFGGVCGDDHSVETATAQSGLNGVGEYWFRTKQFDVFMRYPLASPSCRDNANSDNGTS